MPCLVGVTGVTTEPFLVAWRSSLAAKPRDKVKLDRADVNVYDLSVSEVARKELSHPLRHAQLGSTTRFVALVPTRLDHPRGKLH
jgi:hypothetical protein